MFVVDVQYAYLVAHLPYVFMWIGLYVYFPHVRQALLGMSLVCSVGGPLSELLYFRDYWSPESAFPIRIGPIHTVVEDLLFAFTFTGIVSVMYQTVRSKVLMSDQTLPGGARYACLAVAIISLLLVWLGVRTIYATMAGFLSGTLYMLSWRKDLARVSVESGGLTVLVMAAGHTLAYLLIANSDEVVQRFWYSTYTEVWGKWSVLAVELIWAFAFGTLFGPLYAFARRKRYG